MRKPDFCICENKDADQLRGNREADQRLCFRYTDSTIPLLPKYEISSLYPSSVTVQPSLCGTWSETPKTGFLITRLIYKMKNGRTSIVFGIVAWLRFANLYCCFSFALTIAILIIDKNHFRSLQTFPQYNLNAAFRIILIWFHHFTSKSVIVGFKYDITFTSETQSKSKSVFYSTEGFVSMVFRVICSSGGHTKS